MNRLSTFIKILFLTFIVKQIDAQNATDALRYSYLNQGGTARAFGVGGSFGAMGGDFSSISINPAGLASFRRSEFTISPSLRQNTAESYFKNDNNKISNKKYSNFGIDNIGLVLTKNKKNNATFAIGFNVIADLNRSFEFSGKTLGSITERFIERANQKSVNDLDDFEGYAAYNVGAIFDADSNRVYESDFSKFDLTTKNQRVNQTGTINEISFAFAKNMNDKFHVGLALGIPFVNFEETKTYKESDPENENPIFTELKYDEYLNTSGAGLNIKGGFVYLPVKYLRLGGSFQTPTWYVLNDDYTTSLKYTYFDKIENSFDYASPDGSFKYKLNTPARVTGSIGTILDFGKVKGFINGDAEWIDYNTNKFNFGAFSTDASEKLYSAEINREIESYLGTVLNLRLGGELAIGKIRLRAGVQQGQDPISANNESIYTTSFGIGVRDENFFLDLGVRRRNSVEGYVPYVLLDQSRESVVNTDLVNTKLVVTAGFKF